jgi:hypothetical protein
MSSPASILTTAPDARRLHFLALHVDDLQSLKWAGFEIALVATPALPLSTPTTNRWLFGALLSLAFAWMLWFRAYGRRRFGRTTLSQPERVRQRYPSRMIAWTAVFFAAGQLVSRWYFHVRNGDWILSMVIVSWMLSRALDTTNLVERRIAYGAGLAISGGLYGWLALLDSHGAAGWMQAFPVSAFGALLLSLSWLDFHLLRKAMKGVTDR